MCRAGGLGSLPTASLSFEDLASELTKLRDAVGPKAAINVNFFCHKAPDEPSAEKLAGWHCALSPFYEELGLDASKIPSGGGRVPFSEQHLVILEALEVKPAIVSFQFGLPEACLVERVKAIGSLVMSSATTVDEAIWLEQHGCDVIIAQGVEAGGHRGMFLTDDVTTQIGTFALLPQIVAVVKVPVIAAGGIADAAGVRAAMALGASGCQIGSAFLCTPEATTSALYKAALQSPAAKHTALTNLFSGRPARGIVNRLMKELGPLSDLAPAFPLAGTAVLPLRAAAEKQGKTDFTTLWSGQNVGRIRIAPAEEIAKEFIDAWLAQSGNGTEESNKRTRH
jgi:nitronate monooxygenase